MKKLLLCATIAVAMCFASCEGFDASEILDRLDNLENQLDDLKNNEENQGGDNSGDNQGGNEDEIPADKTQAITFADPTTKLICILQWDENEDGELSYEEAATVTDLSTAFKGSSILAFTELKYFTSLEKIADSAFEGCVSLVKITLPEQITTIGTSAFNGCTNLKKIAIPNAVTSIGSSAFSGCTSLTRVDITDLSAWCKIGFSDGLANPLSNGAKLYLNGSELTDITIPSDFTEINAFAFYNCKSLTSVTIPDSVTSIGDNAFYGCTSLPVIDGIRYADTCLVEAVDKTRTSYSIKPGTRFIGNGAFYNCQSLKNVTIPDGVTSIPSWTFGYCGSLYSITIPDSVTSIGTHAFYNSTSLKEVYCKPTTPPAAIASSDWLAFQMNSWTGRKIFVPRNSVDAYKAANGWKDYASDIEGYDF